MKKSTFFDCLGERPTVQVGYPNSKCKAKFIQCDLHFSHHLFVLFFYTYSNTNLLELNY